MATIDIFNAWTNIFFTICFWKTKDFDLILFEYSMLLKREKYKKSIFSRYTQEISINSTKMKISLIYI